MREADAEPETELSESAQLRIAVSVLARHTRTPEELCFAWWDGWGTDVAGLPVTALENSRFHVPHRSYFLLRGSLTDFALWSAHAAPPGPAFVWPADQEWCLANDVDPHWAGIGGTNAALQQLLSEPRLDVTLANPCRRNLRTSSRSAAPGLARTCRDEGDRRLRLSAAQVLACALLAPRAEAGVWVSCDWTSGRAGA